MAFKRLFVPRELEFVFQNHIRETTENRYGIHAQWKFTQISTKGEWSKLDDGHTRAKTL